ncbi:alpha/beta hydrolase [Arthrobacter tecti]
MSGFALAGVNFEEDATSITLTPPNGTSRGLAFYPGARVEALAYVPLLSQVALDGTTVVILKEPLGISLLLSGQAGEALEDHPDITTWAVGGHSLGGVSAAMFAAEDNRVEALLFWASYPLEDLSGSQLDALSISGSEDGLTTPADVDASRELLPDNVAFLEIDGGVHAFFGDYGPQPGDGKPTAERATVQDRIISSTVDFLNDLG